MENNLQGMYAQCSEDVRKGESGEIQSSGMVQSELILLDNYYVVSA
jgi:hypothetical protein